MIRTLSLGIVLLVTGLCATATAHTVHINTAGYATDYRVDGAYHNGDQSLELAEGSHLVTIAWGAGFHFNVDAAGQVSTAFAGASASGSSLTFHLTTVAVDTAGVQGLLRVHYGPTLPGDGNLQVVAGLNYRLSVAYGAAVDFSVAADGTVSSADPAVQASGSTLTFLPVTVNVDTKGVVGWHRIHYGPPLDQATGTLWVLPAKNYLFSVAYGAQFSFTVDPAGNVTTAFAAVTTSGNTLTFHPKSIAVDLAGVAGWHRLHYGPAIDQAAGTLWVLPGLSYLYSTAYGAQFSIAISETGVVDTAAFAGATGGAGSLTLLPIRLQVSTPSNAHWRLHYGPAGHGTSDALVVPGLMYRFVSGGQWVHLTVGVDCSLTPASATLAGVPFTFGCGPVVTDEDGDGVEDDDDLCPNTPDGAVIGTDGCSLAQRFEQACPTGSFKNKGQYVSCISKTATMLVKEGLLTNQEKSAWTKAAAKSK